MLLYASEVLTKTQVATLRSALDAGTWFNGATTEVLAFFLVTTLSYPMIMGSVAPKKVFHNEGELASVLGIGAKVGATLTQSSKHSDD